MSRSISTTYVGFCYLTISGWLRGLVNAVTPSRQRITSLPAGWWTEAVHCESSTQARSATMTTDRYVKPWDFSPHDLWKQICCLNLVWHHPRWVGRVTPSFLDDEAWKVPRLLSLMRLSKITRNHLNIDFDNPTSNLDRELHGHDIRSLCRNFFYVLYLVQAAHTDRRQQRSA